MHSEHTLLKVADLEWICDGLAETPTIIENESVSKSDECMGGVYVENAYTTLRDECMCVV